jgi:hypothetical protein
LDYPRNRGSDRKSDFVRWGELTYRNADSCFVDAEGGYRSTSGSYSQDSPWGEAFVQCPTWWSWIRPEPRTGRTVRCKRNWTRYKVLVVEMDRGREGQCSFYDWVHCVPLIPGFFWLGTWVDPRIAGGRGGPISIVTKQIFSLKRYFDIFRGTTFSMSDTKPKSVSRLSINAGVLIMRQRPIWWECDVVSNDKHSCMYGNCGGICCKTSLSSKCNGGSPMPSTIKRQGRKPNTKAISDTLPS